MSKHIGINGDVEAEPSLMLFPGATSGKWKAEPITLTLHDKIRVNGSKAIFQATCAFTFIGFGPPPGNPPVTGSEILLLKAGGTKLIGKAGGLLLHGDEVQGTYGNKLKLVSSQTKL